MGDRKEKEVAKELALTKKFNVLLWDSTANSDNSAIKVDVFLDEIVKRKEGAKKPGIILSINRTKIIAVPRRIITAIQS